MSPETLRATLGDDAPAADWPLARQALWWAAKGEWDRAHHCAQKGEGMADCDWVHAYLHRAEGDGGNAAYWYRRAGQAAGTGPLAEEWARIAAALPG